MERLVKGGEIYNKLCRVSHWCGEDITFQVDGDINNKDIVSGSKGSMLREELVFSFPQRMGYGMQRMGYGKMMRLEPQVSRSGRQEPMEWGFMSIRKTEHVMTYSYYALETRRINY